MKKQLLFIFFSLLSLSVVAQEIPSRPVPPKLINDFTHTLSPDEAATLEHTVVAFSDSTSTQIAVVIVPTTNGDDPNSYAFKIGRAWGVGSKEFNNGVVLLIAKEDHTISIQTGYGLEGSLPDITAKHIIDDEIVPSFKNGDYYEGISKGIHAIIQATKR